MRKIYITNNFEVWSIDLFRFGAFFLLIIILLLCSYLYFNLSESILGIISFALSIGVSLLISFFISRKDLFSEKILGEILKGVEGDKQNQLEAYRNAIRSKLGSSSIILSRSNKVVLDELEVVFRTYESCWPIVDGKFPDTLNFSNLCRSFVKKQETLLKIYGFNGSSFYWIFKINATFYSAYYDNEIITSLSVGKTVEVPIRLKELIEINDSPIYLVKNQYYHKLIQIRTNTLKLLMELVEKKDKTSIVYAETGLIRYNYVNQLFNLYTEISKKNTTKYKSLVDVISIQILSNTLTILESVKSENMRHLPREILNDKLDNLKKWKEIFSINQLIPIFETYRLQILKRKINLREIHDFALQFKEKFYPLVHAVLNNQLILLLKKGEFVKFLEAYEILNPFMKDQVVFTNEIKIDWRLEKGNLELLYYYHKGTLKTDKIINYHNLIHLLCKMEEDLHLHQAIVYRFAIILGNGELLRWYEEKSILTEFEMKSIKNEPLNNFNFGNYFMAENNLVYMCFPVAISKENLGNYIS